jgi:hypothetical protein
MRNSERQNNRELATAWLKAIGITAQHSVSAHHDGTFSAYFADHKQVGKASIIILNAGGRIVEVTNSHKSRTYHYVRFDMVGAPFMMSQTHADLFVALATEFRNAYNEQTSSEPDDAYVQRFGDAMWAAFRDLKETYEVKWTSERDGKVMRLVFRLTLDDAD